MTTQLREGKSKIVPRVFVALYGNEQPNPDVQLARFPNNGVQEWPTKFAGKPTPANIEKFIVAYVKSAKPDGANAHLGGGSGWPSQPPTRAYVYDQMKGEIIGQWTAPKFWVVENTVSIPQQVLNSIEAAKHYLRQSMSLEEARKKAATFKREDCTVSTWFERDRANVSIECGNETVAEWWDDEVQDMADSGYFTMGKGDAALERSVLDYAVEMGLISESITEGMSVPEQHAFKIAKSTLRMADAMVGVMGGMTKAEARDFLKKVAKWSDAKIAAYEKSNESMSEATENPELAASMDTLVKKANELFPGGFVNGGVKLSLGVPVGSLAVHARPRAEWTSGIFENGPAFRALIQNDAERPVGAVSILGRGEAPGGTSGRGETYSVSFTSFTRGFKPRVMNRAPLAKIVAHVLKVMQTFKSTVTVPAANESRAFNNKQVFDAYVEAALWSSTDDNGDPLDADYDASDIAPSTLRSMKKDVDDFIKYVQAQKISTEGWSSEQFGHDFWLSRNGHGAGFFDRDGPSAKKLQSAAKTYGSYDLYVGDDNKVYAMQESVNEATSTTVRSAIGISDYAPGIVAGIQQNGNVIVFRKDVYDNKGNVNGVFSVVGHGEEVYSAVGYAWNEGFQMSKSEHTAIRKKAARLGKMLPTGPANESVNEGRDWDYERDGPGLLITAPDGRTCFLQGDEASELEDQLDAAKNQKQINTILDAYDDVCEGLGKFKNGRHQPITPRAGSWSATQQASGAKSYTVHSDKPRKFDSLDAATEYANAYFKKTGIVVGVTANESCADAEAILEAKRKAKGIYRTGDNGVFFIPSNKIDKSKVAATDKRMAKKYGKDFAGLSPAQKLARIRGASHKAAASGDMKSAREHRAEADKYASGEGKSAAKSRLAKLDKRRYGHDAKWNKKTHESVLGEAENTAVSTWIGYARTPSGGWKQIASGPDRDSIVLHAQNEQERYGRDVRVVRVGTNAYNMPETISDSELNRLAVEEVPMGDEYMPDGGSEESRSYYYIMHRAKKEGMNSEKPLVFNFVLDISKRLKYDIDAGFQFARHVLQTALGDTPLPPTVVAVIGRGAIPPAVRKITTLPRWATAVGDLTLAKAAALAVLVLEDMNAREECQSLADALAIIVRRLGESVTEARSGDDEITLVYDKDGEYLAKITGGWAKGQSLDAVELGADITSARERARLGDELARYYSLGDRGVFVRDDGGKNRVAGYPEGVGSFVKAAKALGIKVKVQESVNMDIAQKAIAAARKRLVTETSTGARTLGYLLSDAPQSEKDKIAPAGQMAVYPSNAQSAATVEQIDGFLDSVSEAEKMTKAELILMDRKRKKRERRGKGVATGKQRLAAKRNAKKAQRAMLRGTTQRKAEKTRKRRGRLRGND